MIVSMTGFGKATLNQGNKVFSVEIKTLNSKQLDVFCRLPSAYKSYELEIRNLLSSALERGKIDFILTVEDTLPQPKVKLNSEIILAYCKQLDDLSKQLNKPSDSVLQLALSLPDVINYTPDEITEEEWQEIKKLITVASDKTNEFRKHEGGLLAIDFLKRIGLLENMRLSVEKHAAQRSVNIRERIFNSLSELKITIDENRFEQEMIYYIEKLDITEEMVRLKKHLNYFSEVMQSSLSEGKKLSFIAQEIGREINTIGSKANDADIQRIVVNMKDELEKIKEQLSNIL